MARQTGHRNRRSSAVFQIEWACQEVQFQWRPCPACGRLESHLHRSQFRQRLGKREATTWPSWRATSSGREGLPARHSPLGLWQLSRTVGTSEQGHTRSADQPDPTFQPAALSISVGPSVKILPDASKLPMSRSIFRPELWGFYRSTSLSVATIFQYLGQATL